MNDEKRKQRQWKRQLKSIGNKKRRRYLKNVESDPDEFDYGKDRTDILNEPKKEDTD